VRWPPGVRGTGVASGIKPRGEPDLGLIVTDEPLQWAGTFTRNAAAAACVKRCRSLLGEPMRAIVVNSGNANACTGASGAAAVDTTAASAAAALSFSSDEILVASTGPIGVPLPVDLIVRALPAAVARLSKDVEPFARSILTTDRATKTSRAHAGPATVVGVAKGAAMLAPRMATMLAFLVTDAAADHDELQSHLQQAVHQTFDRVSVDACESTNDSVFLLATGAAGPVPPDRLSAALGIVCADLAEQMVRDAEGGNKLVRIRVLGAVDDVSAVSMGKAVAASALWRAAVHGADPNWGRVLAALGAADRSLNLSEVTIAVGRAIVFAGGEPCSALDAARAAMQESEITVTCTVGEGSARAEILSADLSPTYVRFNAMATT
jgi:glutamate N-acetyltransferase/amino-acid N-acetyltransferase